MEELQWLLDVLAMAEAFRRRRQAAGVIQGRLCLLFLGDKLSVSLKLLVAAPASNSYECSGLLNLIVCNLHLKVIHQEGKPLGLSAKAFL